MMICEGMKRVLALSPCNEMMFDAEEEGERRRLSFPLYNYSALPGTGTCDLAHQGPNVQVKPFSNIQPPRRSHRRRSDLQSCCAEFA